MMSPELSAHVAEFAADVHADGLYLGRHRFDRTAVGVGAVAAEHLHGEQFRDWARRAMTHTNRHAAGVAS